MAGLVSLCLGSYYVFDPLLSNASHEKDYAEILKPLLTCMCANAKISFSLYLSGEAIEWIDRCHSEFFSIANELVSKKALEIIGGGFFAPYFPFIPAGDRVVQIEMLTTAIRRATGKKPRGAWLPSSAWDSSMVPVLSSCGVEHVFIDKLMLKHSGSFSADGSFPVSIEENGKAVTAIPLETIAEIQNPEDAGSPQRFCESLLALSGGSGAAEALFIAPQALPPLLAGENPWLSRLFDFALAENVPVCFGTASQIAKNSRLRQQWISLSAGMSPQDVKSPPEGWDAKALSKFPVKQSVMNSSPVAFGLYAKMMYVHTLVNQIRGDKARKNSAREELCRAQNYLLFSRQNAGEAAASAVYAYKKLLSAEKLTRQRGVFSDSLISFDYDFDGQKEYLSQTEFQNMYLHSLGGKIFECAVFSSSRNFCCFSGKSAKAAGGEGLFLDYFAAKDDLQKILKFDTESLPDVFSSNFYQEDCMDAARREVVLKTCGLYGSFEQPIALKKHFLFTKTGLQIQFILKNDSPMNLSGIFATALHFVLASPKKAEPAVSVFSCEAKHVVPQGLSEYPQAEWILISDFDGGAEFKIEANENPGVALRFSGEQDAVESGSSVRGKALSIFLYWQADLSPGYETEKTVFLTIRSAKPYPRNKTIRRDK